VAALAFECARVTGFRMAFELPADLVFNRGKIADPAAFAKTHGARGWLYLNGAEFATMEGGMSYAQVQAAVEHSANVISDPPRVLDLELARQHVAALDELPRPTLVTCRAGPRSSAVVYLYAGLAAGAGADEVIAAAERDGALFVAFEEYKQWVRDSLVALRTR
jgi:hypothetical protein